MKTNIMEDNRRPMFITGEKGMELFRESLRDYIDNEVKEGRMKPFPKTSSENLSFFDSSEKQKIDLELLKQQNKMSEQKEVSFSVAVEALKKGKKVCRQGWNGKGMWLKLVNPYEVPGMNLSDKQVEAVSEGATALSYIAMKTANNEFVPWLASQTDILSEDWLILN